MHVASSDFRVDISLNLLTLVVSGAIALALLWQLVILLERPTPSDAPPVRTSTEIAVDDAGPPVWAAMTEHLIHPKENSGLPLSLPRGSVFRCKAGGRVTYSDRPCERGEVRVLQLPKG